jgi:hypothetical protein
MYKVSIGREVEKNGILGNDRLKCFGLENTESPLSNIASLQGL